MSTANVSEVHVIRESYVVLIARLVALEGMMIMLHFVVSSTVSAVQSSFLDIPAFLPFLSLALVQIFNVSILISVVLRWLGITYTIRGKEIVVKRGVLNTQAVSYDTTALQAVTLIQNLIGKLCNFGTIKLYNPILKEDIYLVNIHDPQKYIDVLKGEVRSVGFLPRIRPVR